MVAMLKAFLVLDVVMLAHALAGSKINETAKINETDAHVEAVKSGSCECISWAKVYADGLASCGRGNELYFLAKWGFSAAYAATEPITGLPHKVCVDFFKNYMTPSCLNVDMLHTVKPTAMASKQWCYVSNDCPDLNGGSYATNQHGFAQGAWSNLISTGTLAWKICEEGTGDPMTKTWSIPDIVGAAQYSDVSLSRMFRLAYPAVNISYGVASAYLEAVNEAYSPGLTLADMVDSVTKTSSLWGAAAVDAQTRLGDIIKSEQPTILDSLGHGDNYHIVAGRAVYQVARIPNGNMAYLGGHFFDEFTIECISGCALEGRNSLDLDTL